MTDNDESVVSRLAAAFAEINPKTYVVLFVGGVLAWAYQLGGEWLHQRGVLNQHDLMWVYGIDIALCLVLLLAYVIAYSQGWEDAAR